MAGPDQNQEPETSEVRIIYTGRPEHVIQAIVQWHTFQTSQMQEFVDSNDITMLVDDEEKPMSPEFMSGFQHGLKMAIQHYGQLPFTISPTMFSAHENVRPTKLN
ncbi:MAG: hypothetical protein E6R03_08920 [Hyphomicrobiaceae bacterium]|nr:MAG: hypothetical protein E6R03_08920 [Hyphomicrobiaceae bacterium]